MSTDVIPTSGRIVMAQAVSALPYLFALSSGNPAWDGQHGGENPPTPGLGVTGVLNAFGYTRPTIVDFIKEDANGQIVSSTGARYSVSDTPTRYLRFRLSVPLGSYTGSTLREVGLFAFPEIDPSVPSGARTIDPEDVINPGKLLNIHWREPVPLESGDSFAQNFYVRI